MKKSLYLIAILALFLQPLLSFLPAASAQEGGDEPPAPTYPIYYVKPVATGTGDCSSWNNACGLQTALGAAVSGDEIRVQAGTYIPGAGTDRTATFTLKSGVALYGGFAGTETSRDQRDWEMSITMLSGDIGTVEDNSDNSYHVVTGSGTVDTAILDGFTITSGNANGASEYSLGGGMYNDAGSLALTNVTFSGNHAGNGGGMFNRGSSITLANVTFSGNSVTYSGGGMFSQYSSLSLQGVKFNGNQAGYGAGISESNCSPTLTNVTFSGNHAGRRRRDVQLPSAAPPLTNVTFSRQPG